MKLLSAIILSSLVLPVAMMAQSVKANKKVVYDFYRVVWEPRNAGAIPQFMADSYVEHNPMFNGGRDDLMGFLKTGKFGDWSKTDKPVDTLKDPPALIVAEGDMVTWIFKHTRKDPKDPTKTYESFSFDAFRVKNGKIVEHWDGAARQ